MNFNQKYPIAQHPLEQPFGLRLAVSRLDPDQHQQAPGDFGDRGAIHLDPRGADPLKQPDHAARVAGAEAPATARTGSIAFA